MNSSGPTNEPDSSNDVPGCLSMLPLEVDALCYSINGTNLLNDIQLRVNHSGVTVVLGHNGAGKSLLLRVLHGLLPPTDGQIRWNGISGQELEVRKNQAMVFQKPVVLRRSVAANIDYVLKLRRTTSAPRTYLRERRNELLKSANLLTKANQQATSLSGGEQQRLAIARAMATNPSIVFLDEPTASMDPASTAAIEEQVRRISQTGIKVVMVTHDIAQAKRLADDVVFLHQGSVTEYTSASTFFHSADSGAAQRYLDGQL